MNLRFHPNIGLSQKNMNVFIYINFKRCQIKQSFLYGWKCGKIKKETKEIINTKFRRGHPGHLEDLKGKQGIYTLS